MVLLMEKLKFCVVVVTYNRLSLLKECLQNIFLQSYPFNEIIVINNSSTDGTYEYLENIKEKNSDLKIFHMKINLGGAGGFYFALSKVTKSLDYVLLIDDDAMIANDFLYKILLEINDSINAYSGTVYTDGKIDTSHRRIIKNKILMTKKDVPLHYYKKKFFFYDLSTFCGLIINCKLLDKIGLPKQEYFIWYDDTEYSLRIREYTVIKNINNAIINHKTKIENSNNLTWKSYYGYRNQIDMGKNHSLCPCVFLIYRYSYHMYKIFYYFVKSIINKNKRLYFLRCMQLNIIVLKDSIQNKLGKSAIFPPGKQI